MAIAVGDLRAPARADEPAVSPAGTTTNAPWAWEWTAPERIADVRAWGVVESGGGLRRVVAALLDDGGLVLLDSDSGRPLADGTIQLPPGSRIAGAGQTRIGRWIPPAALVFHHPARAMVIAPLLPLRANTLFERDATPRLDADADPEFQTRLLQVAVRSPYVVGLWSDGALQTFTFGEGKDHGASTALPDMLPSPATGELFLTPRGVFYAYLEDAALRVLASGWRRCGVRAGSPARVRFNENRPVVLTVGGDSLLGVDSGSFALLSLLPGDNGPTAVERFEARVDVMGAVARRCAVSSDGSTLAIVEKDRLCGYSTADARLRWSVRLPDVDDGTVSAAGEAFVVCDSNACVNVRVSDGVEIERTTVAAQAIEAAERRTFEVAERRIRGFPPR